MILVIWRHISSSGWNSVRCVKGVKLHRATCFNRSRSSAGTCYEFANKQSKQANKQTSVCHWFLAAVMSPLLSRQAWPQTTQAGPLTEAPVHSPVWPRRVKAEWSRGRGGWLEAGKGQGSRWHPICPSYVRGCHSNRLMQGSPKEKKRQRQSRKGLGEDNRATCRWADLSFGTQ